MGTVFEIPKPKLKVRVMVRDKDGNPKIDDPKKIATFRHLLSESDITYLEKQYGKGILDLDSSP